MSEKMPLTEIRGIFQECEQINGPVEKSIPQQKKAQVFQLGLEVVRFYKDWDEEEAV